MKKVLAASLSLLLALVVLMSAATIGRSDVTAQDTGDAAQLTGRLGGSLADMELRFGDPDWAEPGLVGYNSIVLNDVDTIVVVYYGDDEIVNAISLVYLEEPVVFADVQVIADVVAQVAPQDGVCETEQLAASGLGPIVYACVSEALTMAITSDAMAAAGYQGALGSYSYTVDPLADDFFEILVRPGTDLLASSPSAIAIETTAVVDDSAASGGLGLSQATWEAEHGPGDDVGLMSYENQKYLVTFIRDRVYNFSVNLGVPTSTQNAAIIGLTYIPVDSVYVGSGYDDFGNPLDYYQSAWLAEVLPVTADFDPYLGAPPGTLFTLYSLDSDGSVDSLLIAASASP